MPLKWYWQMVQQLRLRLCLGAYLECGLMPGSFEEHLNASTRSRKEVAPMLLAEVVKVVLGDRCHCWDASVLRGSHLG